MKATTPNSKPSLSTLPTRKRAPANAHNTPTQETPPSSPLQRSPPPYLPPEILLQIAEHAIALVPWADSWFRLGRVNSVFRAAVENDVLRGNQKRQYHGGRDITSLPDHEGSIEAIRFRRRLAKGPCRMRVGPAGISAALDAGKARDLWQDRLRVSRFEGSTAVFTSGMPMPPRLSESKIQERARCLTRISDRPDRYSELDFFLDLASPYLSHRMIGVKRSPSLLGLPRRRVHIDSPQRIRYPTIDTDDYEPNAYHGRGRKGIFEEDNQLMAPGEERSSDSRNIIEPFEITYDWRYIWTRKCAALREIKQALDKVEESSRKNRDL